jgi:hypothetical protein
VRGLDGGRFEIKYAVAPDQCAELVASLAESVVPDPHADLLPSGRRGYVVHSTYFDTPDLLDYTARLSQHRVRRRVRVRTYGAAGEGRPVFLEIKRKLDERVIKQRGLVTDADTWATLGERPWEALLDAPDLGVRAMAARFSEVVRQVGLVPNVSVQYEREVYVGTRLGDARMRLTIDRAIQSARAGNAADLYPPPEVAVLPLHLGVLELKFDGVEPVWMRTVTRVLGVRPEPISKYALAVAKLLRRHRPAEVEALLPRCARSTA